MKRALPLALLQLLFWVGLLPTPAFAQQILSDAPAPGIVRELGYVAMSDATRLAYVVFRPEAAGRYPTVMMYDVYGAGSMAPIGLVREFVSRGYAFVGASGRGTGCSEGEYFPYNQPPEARDGAALVEWAGEQSWSTGKVGLIGNSQPGIIQFPIAALHPKHLAAIAPGGIVASMYADFVYPGGIEHASIPLQWSKFGQASGSRAGAQRRAQEDSACKERAAMIGPNSLWQSIQRERFDADYYRQPSPITHAAEVSVPTLIVQSWTDPAVMSSGIWVFDRLASKHKRLFVLTGGHDAYIYSTAQTEVMRWMDRWLKGEKNGVEGEPHVRIDFGTKPEAAAPGDIRPAKAEASVTLRHWPAPGTKWQTFFLSADGKLDAKHPTGAGNGTREYFYPIGTEVPADDTRFAMAPTAAGALSYRSAPVTKDVPLIGAPQLRFYASSNQPNTDFMAMLHDVSPDGDVTFIQRAYLRASHRAIDANASSDQRVVRPHLVEESLVPSQPYEFRLSFWPVAHVLRAGHAVELMIVAPSNIPSTAFEGFGMLPLMLSGVNTLYQDAKRPSQLLLPTVPDLRVPMPPAECGSLPFQPCRRAAKPAGTS